MHSTQLQHNAVKALLFHQPPNAKWTHQVSSTKPDHRVEPLLEFTVKVLPLVGDRVYPRGLEGCLTGEAYKFGI